MRLPIYSVFLTKFCSPGRDIVKQYVLLTRSSLFVPFDRTKEKYSLSYLETSERVPLMVAASPFLSTQRTKT